MTSIKRPHVIIIGAGFAGLTAAYQLQTEGYKTTVLEARQRVSGRVWSHKLSNGATVEMGAEWICPGENEIKTLAKQLDIPLVEVGVDFMIRDVVKGEKVSVADQRTALRIATEQARALDQTAVANTNIAQFLQTLPITHAQRKLIATRLQGSFGRSLDDICLPMLIEDGLGDLNDHLYYRIAGGNQNLALTLASHLPDIRLDHIVTAISYDAQSVTIQGINGEKAFTLTAAMAVVAIPITKLQTLPFTPPLPQPIAKAIATVPMGTAAKIAVGTTEPPSLRAIQDVENPYWCWSGYGSDGKVRSAITAFCGSHQAQTNLATDSNDPTTWFNELQTANPDLTFTSDSTLMVDWSQDPWAQGCYSAYNQEAFDSYPMLSQPVNTIFFAGEHTAAHSGTMNGAVASGLKAAEQIIQKEKIIS